MCAFDSESPRSGTFIRLWWRSLGQPTLPAVPAEVEFWYEQTRAQIQCGSRNRRNGGNRRRARCCARGSDRVLGARRIDSAGSVSETLGQEAALPVETSQPAQRQIDDADAWWQVNRTAAPNAIREDFEAMTSVLARSPKIGRRATNTKARDVRQVFLRRVGYIIYYRVIGSPPVLEVMAFWHARRGKGPPI